MTPAEARAVIAAGLAGRESMGCSDKTKRREDIKDEWKSDDSRALIREWMTLVGLDERILEECS